MSSSDPFERDGFLDEPAVIGARWWQQGLADADRQEELVTRRKALGGIVAASIAIAGIGSLIAFAVAEASDDDSDDYKTESRKSLDMQREYGWNFGAHTESLAFDGTSYIPFSSIALDSIASDLAPGSPLHAPWASPTLFQSPSAMPTSTAAGDPASGFRALKHDLRPIFTPAMEAAFGRGRSLAGLLYRMRDAVAVIVDLPGPEAVAFAAGMSEVFDPVFLFENWPHPRGVVPAHLTLAAAAYYQPLFVKTKSARPNNSPALFVLDRNRLNGYTDENTQFDNRWVAKLPNASSLSTLAVKHVLYVTPSEDDSKEMNDVNDDLVAYAKSSLDVRMVGASAFRPDIAAWNPPPTLYPPSYYPTKSQPTSATPIIAKTDAGPPDAPSAADLSHAPATYFYGGSVATHESFYFDYPWAAGDPAATKASIGFAARDYRPTARATPFSSGSGAAVAVKPIPSGFGTIPVVILIATGVIQGAKLSRSGSWLRAGGGYGG